MYPRVSMPWNPLNGLDRTYLAPDFRKNSEIRDILKDKLFEFHYKVFPSPVEMDSYT